MAVILVCCARHHVSLVDNDAVVPLHEVLLAAVGCKMAGHIAPRDRQAGTNRKCSSIRAQLQTIVTASLNVQFLPALDY